MSRFLSVFLFFVLAIPAQAQQAGQALARAMDAMRDGNWAEAQIEARADGQEALDVILWHYFRAENGTADAVMDFLQRRPDWPGLPYLKQQTEAVIAEGSHDQVLSFFDGYTPQSGVGALASARAHLAKGNRGAAEAEIVLAWRTLSLSQTEHDAFLAEWGDLLKDHHTARLDMAIWNGWSQNARRMFAQVDDDWRASSEARLALRAKADGVDALIEAVPSGFKNGAGLAYERFRWRWTSRQNSTSLPHSMFQI